MDCVYCWYTQIVRKTWKKRFWGILVLTAKTYWLGGFGEREKHQQSSNRIIPMWTPWYSLFLPVESLFDFCFCLFLILQLLQTELLQYYFFFNPVLSLYIYIYIGKLITTIQVEGEIYWGRHYSVSVLLNLHQSQEKVGCLTFSYYTNFPLGFCILHCKHPSLT